MDTWVEHDGIRLAVRWWKGERSPVVLLHAAGSNLEEWTALVPHLLELGHTVVTYDARSHGLSDSADDLSFDAQVHDLVAVLSDLKIAKPVLVGASMGAMVGLEYATSTDDAVGLVSLDGPISDLADRVAAGQSPPDDDALEQQLIEEHFDGDVVAFETALPSMLRAAPFVPEALRRRQHAVAAERATRRPSPEQMAQISRFGHRQPATRLLREVERPTLLVMASRPEPDDDAGWARTEARRMVAARITNPLVQVQWVPTGHHVAAEAPDLVVELLREFLEGLRDEVEPPSSPE